MHIDRFKFGSVRIDGETYERDVVIDRGRISPRKKKASKRFRDDYGHTPLSLDEPIPWKCTQLVIGTGADGALPVMSAVIKEAQRRGVEVVQVKTAKAIQILNTAARPKRVNAVLHITC